MAKRDQSILESLADAFGNDALGVRGRSRIHATRFFDMGALAAGLFGLLRAVKWLAWFDSFLIL
jgi:hypothetical protein